MSPASTLEYPLEVSISEVKAALETSQFLKDVEAVKAKFSGAEDGKYRKLIGAEKWQMEQQGVRAEDWNKVLVTHDFESARVQNCTLQGNIRLGNFSGYIHLKRRGIKLPAGVYNCDLNNVTVEDGALVSRVSLISNCFIGHDACVMGCGEVTCTGDTSFGNGIELPLAIETGGRDTGMYAEMTVAAAAGVASNRSDKKGLSEYKDTLKEYVAKATSPVSIIGWGARVMHTPKVTNVYMGPGAIIDSAVCVNNVTMLSTLEECSMILAGCEAKNTLMQWGSTLEGVSMTSNALLCEYSTVIHHGKVGDSIIGPNSLVSEGECTAALCGPFVMLEHQALLIACFWPQGKGSLGYGANVGSNHTSKAPDQELWSGEGTFYGLGCCIKYPTDLTQAAYSVVGSGAITLPQKFCFPFSLISSPAANIAGISPAFNEVTPAWSLSHNIETLRRNENRMIKTNRAVRQKFTFDVLRPETVDQMIEARDVLKSAAGKATLHTETGEAVYTEKQAPGLGKNYMRECKRIAGVEVYTFYIQYYCLMGMYEQLKGGAPIETVLSDEVDKHFWAHQRPTLSKELPGVGVRELLKMLLGMKAKITSDVRASKEVDDVLGRAVISDYEEAHRPAHADPFVVESEQRMAEVAKDVETWLAGMPA
eukprot:comp21505_c0_seq1/m.29831 comp21505_c0_seq1/g.29831  ORF comp21505_c0_seq1/g.29831 comp21505_c0_seq1/m.29831 type:complete len:650 (-) comp21505_c0_seq1:31-1980(-)